MAALSHPRANSGWRGNATAVNVKFSPSSRRFLARRHWRTMRRANLRADATKVVVGAVERSASPESQDGNAGNDECAERHQDEHLDFGGLIGIGSQLLNIGVGDAARPFICDCGYPSFVLSYWARDRARGTLPLETAIRILTREPAALFGMDDRGLVAEGKKADLNVLGTIGWDIGRFGIQFVASPRHADALVITGPVSMNMHLALEKTWRATPDPKWVVAVGDCACGGGLFAGSYACVGAVEQVVPVDLHIRGCPPSPTALLQGLIALIEASDTAQAKRA